ncbi:hypothetical protein FI206_02545 [Salmonella enterica subsp. enterica]|nr:hypothetical protein [Salmonella enterica subsp. enterica serovar Hessarek]
MEKLQRKIISYINREGVGKFAEKHHIKIVPLTALLDTVTWPPETIKWFADCITMVDSWDWLEYPF